LTECSWASTGGAIAAPADIVDLDSAGVAPVVVILDVAASWAAGVANVVVSSLHRCASPVAALHFRVKENSAAQPDEVSPAVPLEVSTAASCQQEKEDRLVFDGANSRGGPVRPRTVEPCFCVVAVLRELRELATLRASAAMIDTRVTPRVVD
jgi:hypothetical protein